MNEHLEYIIEKKRSAEVNLALTTACMKGDLEIVKKIVYNPGADGLYDVHDDSNFIFYIACERNHWTLLNFLLTDDVVVGKMERHPVNSPMLSKSIEHCYEINGHLLEFQLLQAKYSTKTVEAFSEVSLM